MENSYYEKKKQKGYIFTERNMNPKAGTNAMQNLTLKYIPVTDDGGYSYWSHLSGRYRTYEEQIAFVNDGGIDKKLPPLV